MKITSPGCTTPTAASSLANPTKALQPSSSKVIDTIEASASTPSASSLTPAPSAPAIASTETRIQNVLKHHGLPNISVDISTTVVAAQSTLPGNTVSFEKAFGKAIHSFLNSSDDIESPLSLFENEFENPATRLMEFLNASTAQISLVEGNEYVDGASWYPAENGEDVESNWIFALKINNFSDHLFWAVVPRNGEAPYNYGFN